MPPASALLADWGAEVIKVEHVERGDTMWGRLKSSGLSCSDRPCAARALEPGQAERRARPHRPRRLDILYKLAAMCDAFVTNKMPGVRTKLKIDVDDVRSYTPDIIGVRGVKPQPVSDLGRCPRRQRLRRAG